MFQLSHLLVVLLAGGLLRIHALARGLYSSFDFELGVHDLCSCRRLRNIAEPLLDDGGVLWVLLNEREKSLCSDVSVLGQSIGCSHLFRVDVGAVVSFEFLVAFIAMDVELAWLVNFDLI